LLSLEGKSVLVTGGAGFIGSHVVERLVKEKPSELVVVDNFFLGKMENLEEAKKNFPKLRVYNQDVCAHDAMKRIMSKHDVEVVFDLAVLPLPLSLKKPEFTFKKNVDMTTNLCRLIREDAYQTLIHFSSSEVYGSALYDPMDESHQLGALTPYGASKAAGDLLIQSYRATFGIDEAIVRPFNNYGPRQNDKSYAGIIPITLKRIFSGESPIIFGTGKQTRDYTFVTDTAEAALMIYKEPRTRGRILNVGSGKETSIIQLVKLILKYAGCNKKIMFEKPRPGDVTRHIADITELKKLTNFKPKIKLDEGIKRTVEWYHKRFYKSRPGIKN